jgi:hypothetical protein
MRKLTRMESNKEARRVLHRHHVDLSYCHFFCSGRDLLLTGQLYKTDGSDFTGTQIYTMIEDFHRSLVGYTINGELDNWHFNSERITYVGDRHHYRPQGQLPTEEQEIYEIFLEDFDDFDTEAS